MYYKFNNHNSIKRCNLCSIRRLDTTINTNKFIGSVFCPEGCPSPAQILTKQRKNCEKQTSHKNWDSNKNNVLHKQRSKKRRILMLFRKVAIDVR